MMMADLQDIEEQCDNAVFEVCDARERYPKRCAEELGKYLHLKNNIAMEPVVLKPPPQIFDVPKTDETIKCGTLNDGCDRDQTWAHGAEQLQSFINKVRNLKVALKQLQDNKNFEIKHHFK